MEIKLRYFFLILLFFSSCASFEKREKISEIFSLMKSRDQEIKSFSKEEIYSFKYPIIEVRTNGLVKQALMLPISSRLNYTNYVSGSGPTITMNRFMVSKTNAMNTFLNSVETESQSPLLSEKIPSKWNGSFLKKYIFLTPMHTSEIISYKCIFNNYGKDTIIILEETLILTKIVETCNNKSKQFKNYYWLEKNGFVRKSKQLISKDDIYSTIIVLKK